MTKKKNYSEEFKKSSSELAVTGTKSISQTAKDLGVNANTLYGWIEKYHPGKKTNVNSQVEISVYEELKLLKKQKKSSGVLCEGNYVKYAWINNHKLEFKVSIMCKLLDVSRSSYYSWLCATPSKLSLENIMLSSQIKEIFIQGRGNYGSRRIRKILLKKKIIISRRRVIKLMKANNLVCKTAKKFKVTTDSKHKLPIAPNVLQRDFNATKPNKKYVGDITYIWTREGWLYLAVVIDLFSRKVVGWAMDKNMEASLVNDALLMAIWQRKPSAGLIWHTDRGSQYASTSHRKIIKQHKIIQSMSRKGELVHHMDFKTREEAKQEIFEYIEVFYNQTRTHSANDYNSPVEFEMISKIS